MTYTYFKDLIVDFVSAPVQYIRNQIDEQIFVSMNDIDQHVVGTIDLIDNRINQRIDAFLHKYITKPLNNIRLALEAGAKVTFAALVVTGFVVAACYASAIMPLTTPLIYAAIKFSLYVGVAAAVARYTAADPKYIDQAANLIFYPIQLFKRAKNWFTRPAQVPAPEPAPEIVRPVVVQPQKNTLDHEAMLSMLYKGCPMTASTMSHTRDKAKQPPDQAHSEFVPQNRNWLKNRLV